MENQTFCKGLKFPWFILQQDQKMRIKTINVFMPFLFWHFGNENTIRHLVPLRPVCSYGGKQIKQQQNMVKESNQD